MEWVSGNIYIRPNELNNIGDYVQGHTHNFDHTTIVFTGAVKVKATLSDGTKIEREFEAPDHFLVKAEVEHYIEATKPNTIFWCVYSHRTPQGDIIEYHDGWNPAYR